MRTQEEIETLLCDLDRYARDYDPYEHGLPTHDEHLDNLTKIVTDWLLNNEKGEGSLEDPDAKHDTTQTKGNLRLL